MLFGLMDEAEAAHHRTCMKLVCVGPTQRVAGVHIIGEGADEMLQVRTTRWCLGLTFVSVTRSASHC